MTTCIVCGRRFNGTHEPVPVGAAFDWGFDRDTCSRRCALQRDYALKLIAEEKGDRTGVVVPEGTMTRWDSLR